MSGITTHVLDTTLGRPASGVPLTLECQTAEGWSVLGTGATDQDGRCRTLLGPEPKVEPGVYRLTFDTGTYFDAIGQEGFYPSVTVVFTIRNAEQHYHVPLLLSLFGYSTYRGS
ncbi:MAG: hydroxyisourate hydrolase [Blastocatellia bacterium]|nr:hydroxyisourate hydrolase [Blastocatellia bacterium]